MTPARLAAIEERLREFEPELDASTRERMMEVIPPEFLMHLCEAAYALGATDSRRMRSMSVEERMAHARQRVLLVLGPKLSPAETVRRPMCRCGEYIDTHGFEHPPVEMLEGDESGPEVAAALAQPRESTAE